MLQVRILIFLILLVLIDFYFFRAVRIVIRNLTLRQKQAIKVMYFSVTAMAFCYVLAALITPYGAWPKYLKTYLTSIFFIISVSKLIGLLFVMGDDIIRVLRYVLRFITGRRLKVDQVTFKGEPIPRSQFISNVAIAAAAVPFSTLMFGMFKGAYDYHVFRIPLKIPNLPAGFEGASILQVSDIHTGSFGSLKPLREATALMLDQGADFIFFTGDLVNDRSDEAIPYLDILSQLAGKAPVFSILGNHDYGDYMHWPDESEKLKNMQLMHQIHRDIGWDLLLNENRQLERNGDKINLVGVENWSATPRFTRYGNLSKAMEGLSDAPATFLLTHDPTHWNAEIKEKTMNIGATFSGHTHGMQFGIELPNFKWSPSQYIYDQWAGLYQEGSQQLYVNRGLGFLGYSGRVGIHPEITIFELSRL